MESIIVISLLYSNVSPPVTQRRLRWSQGKYRTCVNIPSFAPSLLRVRLPPSLLNPQCPSNRTPSLPLTLVSVSPLSPDSKCTKWGTSLIVRDKGGSRLCKFVRRMERKIRTLFYDRKLPSPTITNKESCKFEPSIHWIEISESLQRPLRPQKPLSVKDVFTSFFMLMNYLWMTHESFRK